MLRIENFEPVAYRPYMLSVSYLEKQLELLERETSESGKCTRVKSIWFLFFNSVLHFLELGFFGEMAIQTRTVVVPYPLLDINAYHHVAFNEFANSMFKGGKFFQKNHFRKFFYTKLHEQIHRVV